MTCIVQFLAFLLATKKLLLIHQLSDIALSGPDWTYGCDYRIQVWNPF